MTVNLADIKFRPRTPADIPTVLERNVVLYEEDFNYPPDAFGQVVSEGLEELSRKGGILWIAEYHPDESGTPQWAGSIAIVPSAKPTGRVRFLLVAAPFRSCGLGGKLLNVALEYCKEEGIRRVTLSTAADCVSAHKIHRDLGFERVKISEGTPWGGGIHEWWEKKLPRYGNIKKLK